jgi:hypothetical protein
MDLSVVPEEGSLTWTKDDITNAHIKPGSMEIPLT